MVHTAVPSLFSIYFFCSGLSTICALADSLSVSTNVLSVNYTDEQGQLLDTLPVCRDFKYGECKRAACKYIHLLDDHVEITDMRVTVCRDAVSGKCLRNSCKFYHLPIVLPHPAAIASTLAR